MSMNDFMSGLLKKHKTTSFDVSLVDDNARVSAPSRMKTTASLESLRAVPKLTGTRWASVKIKRSSSGQSLRKKSAPSRTVSDSCLRGTVSRTDSSLVMPVRVQSPQPRKLPASVNARMFDYMISMDSSSSKTLVSGGSRNSNASWASMAPSKAAAATMFQSASLICPALRDDVQKVSAPPALPKRMQSPYQQPSKSASATILGDTDTRKSDMIYGSRASSSSLRAALGSMAPDLAKRGSESSTGRSMRSSRKSLNGPAVSRHLQVPHALSDIPIHV